METVIIATGFGMGAIVGAVLATPFIRVALYINRKNKAKNHKEEEEEECENPKEEEEEEEEEYEEEENNNNNNDQIIVVEKDC